MARPERQGETISQRLTRIAKEISDRRRSSRNADLIKEKANKNGAKQRARGKKEYQIF